MAPSDSQTRKLSEALAGLSPVSETLLVFSSSPLEPGSQYDTGLAFL